ncbi:MAG: LamG-like jellyroll fold domain-containing protein [Phycisphaeraceae bacterium]
MNIASTSWLTVLGLLLLTMRPATAPAADADEARWQPKWQELASLGRGYVVWESNRDGRWRLWVRNLDGSGKRQLSPDEAQRDHYAPHIAPDGRRIAYISYPHNQNAYGKLGDNQTAQLRLIDADGRNDRELARSARAYFENRAAVWINNQELIYIDGDGYTARLHVDTGESTRLTRESHQDYGWLIDPTLTHAVDGRPRFSPYDADEQTIAAQRRRSGCQPYFTRDGRWGFWVNSAGGPIRRVHLASGEVSDILGRDDPRMPRDRNYLYFPMVSPCQRLFAVAASPDEHDHHRSDYDIFIFRMDPKTLEVIGEPVRYTFDEGTDRFPDVFLADAELGTHQGEAPLTVSLNAEADGDWEWDFGDGTTHRGQTAEHTYAEPGGYTVTARRGDAVLHGTVVVEAAAPPRIRLPVIVDDRRLTLTFNEPVAFEQLTLRTASGNRIEKWEASEDQQRLTVWLDESVSEQDELHVDGVTDRAQQPNAMPAKRLAIEPMTWPADLTGLLFAWETADKPNRVPDPTGDGQRTFAIEPRGLAMLNHAHAMVLRDGAFVAEDAVNDLLLDALRETNELTLEATIQPDHADQHGPARIVTFSSTTTSRNFTLGQEGSDLVMRLRTPATGDNAVSPQVTLCTLALDKPNHILVTYQPGRLVCYRNGEKVMETDRIKRGFDNWDEQHLLFGDEFRPGRAWQGTLEGVAIYNRFMDADEAEANARHSLDRLAKRPVAPSVDVEAELVGKSRMPTLEEISPYRQALVLYEYRLTEPVADAAIKHEPGDTVRVMHRAILNGKTLAIDDRDEGERYRLHLEPFEANPQVEALYQSDTLPDDFEAPLYFAPRD